MKFRVTPLSKHRTRIHFKPTKPVERCSFMTMSVKVRPTSLYQRPPLYLDVHKLFQEGGIPCNKVATVIIPGNPVRYACIDCYNGLNYVGQ